MSTEETWDGYQAIIPEGSKWENMVMSRVFLTIPFYSPLFLANKVKAPTLLIAAEEDSLVPVKAVKRTAARIKNCELTVLECNHFAPYVGKYFEKIVALENEFLLRTLGN